MRSLRSTPPPAAGIAYCRYRAAIIKACSRQSVVKEKSAVQCLRAGVQHHGILGAWSNTSGRAGGAATWLTHPEELSWVRLISILSIFALHAEERPFFSFIFNSPTDWLMANFMGIFIFGFRGCVIRGGCNCYVITNWCDIINCIITRICN